MIYLIKSAGYKEEEKEMKYFPLLKIGYTEDNRKEIRYSHYRLHNPTCQVLYEIPLATEDHEKRVQYKFRNLLFSDYGREWFEYNEEIIEFFKNIVSLEELDNLPKSPSREDKEFKETKKVIRRILPYLLEFTKEEIYSDEDKVSMKIEKELSKLISLFGDTLSEELVLEYYNSKNPDIVERYNQIKTSRETGVYCEDDIVNKNVSKFMKIYDSYNTMYDKLRCLCEYGLSKDALRIVLGQIADSDEIKSYYLALGPQKLYSLGYNVTKIKKALGIVTFSQDLLKQEIYGNFREGDKYTLANLKAKLGSIYSSINYSATPKASDIENWFEIRTCQFTMEVDGKKKRVNGYELLKSKRDALEERLVE